MNTASWDIQDHNAAEGWPGGIGIVEGNDIPYTPKASRRSRRTSRAGRRWIRSTSAFCRAFRASCTCRIRSGSTSRRRMSRLRSSTATLPPDLHQRDEASGGARVLDGRLARPLGRRHAGGQRGRPHPETWFDKAGNHHSDALRLVERYTLTRPRSHPVPSDGRGLEDFTKPWKMSFPLYRRMEPNARLLNYECLEFMEKHMPWDEVPPGLPKPPAASADNCEEGLRRQSLGVLVTTVRAVAALGLLSLALDPDVGARAVHRRGACEEAGEDLEPEAASRRAAGHAGYLYQRLESAVRALYHRGAQGLRGTDEGRAWPGSRRRTASSGPS